MRATDVSLHAGTIQLTLPECQRSGAQDLDNGKSSFSDPAFGANKTLPVHRWVPWIAGFSSAFVRQIVTRTLKAPATVLDPFAGVGTTLVEAMMLGHSAVGFEINPYAALACRIKTSAHRIQLDRLRSEISQLQTFYNQRVSAGTPPTSSPPKGFRTRSAFYSPAVLHKVLTILDFVSGIEDTGVRDLFRLAFAATMVRYSNYSYEPSLGRRVSAGKQEILDFPVGRAVLVKLNQMAQDVSWLRANLTRRQPEVCVIDRSFFEYEECLAPETVDMIITSPPYLNNYHYNRNTRPQLYWLGYAESPSDLKRLEHANFGTYWQTVRDQAHVGLSFSLPGTDLEDRLQQLRERNPDKGTYGGNGWANYAVAYFNDCLRFAEGIKYALRPGGTALVVIGNSILQGLPIATDFYFARIAESVGLRLVRIAVPRNTRVGNSIVQSSVRVGRTPKSSQLYEAVVELATG